MNLGDWAHPRWPWSMLTVLDPALGYWLLIIINACQICLDWILDFFFGYTTRWGTKTERTRAEDQYEYSAQVLQVLWRGTYSFVAPHKLHNFLVYHVEYTNPDIILKRSNVSLFSVSKDYSLFAVTPQGVDLYDTRLSPFVVLYQYLACHQLIKVPTKTLHKFGDSIGDPVGKDVTVMQMTSRCGSTLVTQMLSRIPQVRVQSEPFPLVHVQGLFLSSQLSVDEVQQFIQTVIRIQLKDESGSNIDKEVIKFTPFVMGLQPILKRCFPNFKYLFITRHVKNTIQSLVNIRASLGFTFRNSRLSSFYLYDHLPFPNDDVEWWEHRKHFWITQRSDHITDIAMFYGSIIASFAINRSDFSKVIFYEKLMEDPSEELASILEELNISKSYLGQALEALTQDSQMGLFSVRGKRSIPIQECQWETADQVFKYLGLPLSTTMSKDKFMKTLMEPKWGLNLST